MGADAQDFANPSFFTASGDVRVAGRVWHLDFVFRRYSAGYGDDQHFARLYGDYRTPLILSHEDGFQRSRAPTHLAQEARLGRRDGLSRRTRQERRDPASPRAGLTISSDAACTSLPGNARSPGFFLFDIF